MTIRINQIAVDFTLEKETTWADLTTALRAWATGQDLAILGILADGKALGPDDATPLSHVREVDVEAVPAGERDLARVAVIARFFSLVVQGCGSGDQELIQELQREFPSVRSALFPLFDVLANRIKDPLDVLDRSWVDLPSVGDAALRLAHVAEIRRVELRAPGPALAESLAAVKASAAGLSDLAQLFQKGEDPVAFDRILALFVAFEDTNRRAGLYVARDATAGQPWEEFHAELRPFLQETEAALASGDYVFLADLMEYEVLPRLARIGDLFPDISNLDPASGVL